jgi:hypothetical protein
MMKIMALMLYALSIVDASRLDLSSPAQAIHPLGLMNRPDDSQTGFDESNPYALIYITRGGYFYGR